MTSPLRDKLTRLVSEDPAELQQRLDEELRRVRALLTVAAALGWILIVGIVVAYFLDLQGVWDSARTTIATAVGGTVLGALIAGFTVYALLVPRRSNLGRILAVAGGEPEELIRRTTRPVPWRETLATLLPVGLLVTSLVLTAESHPVASHIIPTDVVDDLEAQFDDEEFQQAADLCEQQATAFTNVVGAGLSALGRPHEQIQRELEAAHAEESARLLEAVEWAAVIGLVGGFFPAIRAARLPIASALREG